MAGPAYNTDVFPVNEFLPRKEETGHGQCQQTA